MINYSEGSVITRASLHHHLTPHFLPPSYRAPNTLGSSSSLVPPPLSTHLPFLTRSPLYFGETRLEENEGRVQNGLEHKK